MQLFHGQYKESIETWVMPLFYGQYKESIET